jgi:hypothetical protein
MTAPGRYHAVRAVGVKPMELYDLIRAAGNGAIVEELAKDAGVARDQAEEALRTLLPEFGRAIRKAGESRTGAPAVHAALQDERYARYLQDPGALREAAAAADGERVLEEILDEEQRAVLVRSVAAAMSADEASAHRLLPLVATLAIAAIGQRLREQSPQIPWFGSRPDDHFDAPLLNALATLFDQEEETRSQRP